jgi:hypothetical protein
MSTTVNDMIDTCCKKEEENVAVIAVDNIEDEETVNQTSFFVIIYQLYENMGSCCKQ